MRARITAKSSAARGLDRSRRSSSMRARIVVKSSAARGRVTFPPFRSLRNDAPHRADDDCERSWTVGEAGQIAGLHVPLDLGAQLGRQGGQPLSDPGRADRRAARNGAGRCPAVLPPKTSPDVRPWQNAASAQPDPPAIQIPRPRARRPVPLLHLRSEGRCQGCKRAGSTPPAGAAPKNRQQPPRRCQAVYRTGRLPTNVIQANEVRGQAAVAFSYCSDAAVAPAELKRWPERKATATGRTPNRSSKISPAVGRQTVPPRIAGKEIGSLRRADK
jgi:hypothetical protein